MEKTGSKLTDSTDLDLARMASDGNQAAFLVLYDRYKAGVSVYVSQFISQREEIEDITLESFQKGFAQISSYNPEYKFSTWIFRIARNTAFDHLDKSGRISSSMKVNSIDDENAGLGEIATETGNPETDVIRMQEYEKLLAAIEGLSPLYRQVALMVLIDNYGYQEVAEATGLPLNTVRTRVKRAREILLKILDAADED